MMRGGVIFLLAFFAVAPSLAQDKPLKIDLAYNRVDITTGFNGTQVVLFGTTTSPDNHVAVTLKGPEKTMIVRRKGRVAGAWLNRSSLEFRRVPSYYDYAASIPDAELGDANFLNANNIGVEHLDFYPEDEEEAAVIASFREALIRNMQRKGLFPIKAHSLNYTDPSLFKVTFDLPPGVPTGIYTVDVMLIDNSEVLSRETRTFQVGQVGFNAQVYLFANESSLFYGVFTVLIAALAGWGAFTFLRRD